MAVSAPRAGGSQPSCPPEQLPSSLSAQLAPQSLGLNARMELRPATETCVLELLCLQDGGPGPGTLSGEGLEAGGSHLEPEIVLRPRGGSLGGGPACCLPGRSPGWGKGGAGCSCGVQAAAVHSSRLQLPGVTPAGSPQGFWLYQAVVCW